MTIASWSFGDLKPLCHGALLVNPPWTFANFIAKGEAKNPKAHYSCIALEAIKALPAHQLAAPDCALIMWATSPMLPRAIDTMRAWSFIFKSAGAWAKRSSIGPKWAFGTGYCYRSAAEHFLLGNSDKPRQQVRNAQSDRSAGQGAFT